MEKKKLKFGCFTLLRITAIAGLLIPTGAGVGFSAPRDTFDPAQNPATPVMSADSPSKGEPAVTQGILPPKESTSPLSKPSDDKKDPTETALEAAQKLRDVIAKLNLTKEQLDQLSTILKSLTKAIHASDKDSLSGGEALKKALSDLADFVKKVSNPDIDGQGAATVDSAVGVAGLMLNYAFSQLEAQALPKDTLQSQAARNLLESVLKEDPETPVADTATPGLSNDVPSAAPEINADLDQKKVEIMNSALEILRQAAVNDSAPAFQKAMYRSWYTKMASKIRAFRFNHIKLTELKSAEYYKLAE